MAPGLVLKSTKAVPGVQGKQADFWRQTGKLGEVALQLVQQEMVLMARPLKGDRRARTAAAVVMVRKPSLGIPSREIPVVSPEEVAAGQPPVPGGSVLPKKVEPGRTVRYE